ncbi:MAG: SUMF1/EgtB/PvdO family nonheme iron enzyme [Pelatocladus maniniholoensis HA4357-MV3]|jgi:formylglycine-generating enzyme required for sulfatase activity|uniref:SUMF1/EgtB/PvdO family nonheme iron enzyme n=1 Tax=Pelatocladus maniniholoensis HA4357-MV3 TaxID=1117104 RepID=A0A9E3LWB5_9NOST|nr:SUMF1/EgtB/PvdO family nonheme iron enzyme [Pelatocladus maniniholoensis HA4357-MV3]
MAKNWAITIGVNQYEYLQPLNYAKRDAQLMQEFLRQEAGCERIFFFSDDSPDINGKSTRPNRTNLLRLLRQLFETPFMGAGDNLWFFFSGHGIRHTDRDYLMPCDGDPEDIENTAISINFVTERLRRCGADNVVMILDACRSLGTRAGEGIGRQTAEQARQQGVISIFSCSPQEYSYEIQALQQGAFTYALLEGLGIQGKCATVERLNQYLSFRVPELVRQHQNKRQTPYIIAEPVNKSHLILVPRYATLAEIATLKNDAYRAQFKKDFDLAKQLWIRVLAAASGSDMEAIEALEEITRLRIIEQERRLQQKRTLQTFQFETVTVDARGNITNRRNCEAKYFVEDLGNGVTLEMVQIPGGKFLMGSPAGEAGRYDDEGPQHQVTAPSFFMGKYVVTQAQYQAIMDNNPSYFKGEKRPVEQVSWNDTVEFCKRLSEKTGRTYRLPSEAEWEYAARAGTTTPFYFGETITTDLANYRGTDWNYKGRLYPGNYGQGPKGEHREQTTDVGNFPPNSFGLYDMCGNVWEWCLDKYHNNYEQAPTDGSAWLNESDNNSHLLRGGSWLLIPRNCRCANRNWYNPDYRNDDVGFRLVVLVA